MTTGQTLNKRINLLASHLAGSYMLLGSQIESKQRYVGVSDEAEVGEPTLHG